MSDPNDDARIGWAGANELRELHGTEARDLANRFLDDPFEADEVLQLAFERLRHVKRSQLPRDGRFPAKVATLVMRICLDRLGHARCAGTRRK